jgi:hypothetical protein
MKILFVELFLKIKKDKNVNKSKELAEIYDNFISESSRLQLNISGHIFDSFVNIMNSNEEYKNSQFDRLLDSLFQGVKINIIDTYSRFVFSKNYINMIKFFSTKLAEIKLSNDIQI